MATRGDAHTNPGRCPGLPHPAPSGLRHTLTARHNHLDLEPRLRRHPPAGWVRAGPTVPSLLAPCFRRTQAATMTPVTPHSLAVRDRDPGHRTSPTTNDTFFLNGTRRAANY